MYCSTCGTKLADGALFCSNCGTKIVAEETAAAVEEVVEDKKEEVIETVTEVKEDVIQETAEVKEEAVETVTEVKEEVAETVEEVKEAAVEPVTEVVEEVTSEPVTEAVAEVKEETVEPVIEAVEEVKEEASQPIQLDKKEIPAPAETAAEEVQAAPVAPEVEAQNPAAEDNKANKEAKPKKKGKGCLIAVIIFVVILVLLILLLGIGAAIFFLVFKNNGGTASNVDYSNAYAYYGDYEGKSKIVHTYNSQDMVDYLSANGVTADVSDFYTDNSEKPFAISLYNDITTTPAAWDMYVDMGDYLGYQRFNNKTFITYSDYAKSKFAGGDLLADDSQNYHLEVTDTDQNGYLSEALFGFEDNKGTYKITIDGDVTKDGKITGFMTIMVSYGDMANPFTEEIEFEATKRD